MNIFCGEGDQVVVSAGGLYDVALGAPVQGVAVAVLQGDAAGGGGVTSQPGVAGPPGAARSEILREAVRSCGGQPR